MGNKMETVVLYDPTSGVVSRVIARIQLCNSIYLLSIEGKCGIKVSRGALKEAKEALASIAQATGLMTDLDEALAEADRISKLNIQY